MLLDLLMDAFLDSLKLLPFLFLAFLILEFFQQRSGKINQKMLLRFRKAGPLVGALLGCIPECGIPILAANLFAASLITPGTLLAVFLSASDEAILILLGMPKQSHIIPTLLVIKAVVAVVCGYLVDVFFGKYFDSMKSTELHEHDHDHCCHNHSHNMFLHALQHALNLYFFIFTFNFGLNLLLEGIGFTKLASLLLKNSIFQPILSAVIGLIPNCAASVLITELYGQGILSFPSLISGLCATTGLGMFVLLKTCADKKQALKILGALLALSAVVGILLAPILFTL